MSFKIQCRCATLISTRNRLVKTFFSKDRYVGKLTLLVEHESNGRGGGRIAKLEQNLYIRFYYNRRMADGARKVLDSCH